MLFFWYFNLQKCVWLKWSFLRFLASVEMSISGLHYIKDHLEEETSNETPVDGSSASEEEDFFASMKPTHGQEGIKLLDGYLACKADDKEILKSFPTVCKLSLKVNTALPASAACVCLFSPRRMDSKNFSSFLSWIKHITTLVRSSVPFCTSTLTRSRINGILINDVYSHKLFIAIWGL